MNTWILDESIRDFGRRLGRDAVFTLGNGYLGCRGFFDEEQEGAVETLGGIYMAGVFGKGDLKAWKGMDRELVNTPNFLWTSVTVDGEQLLERPKRVSQFSRALDMRRGVLTRSFVWKGTKGQKVRISFERFMSVADIHHAGQRITVENLGGDARLALVAGIDGGVTQHNMVTTLPLPIQPGRPQLEVLAIGDDTLTAKVFTRPDGVTIYEGQALAFRSVGGHSEKVGADSTAKRLGTKFEITLPAGASVTMTKVVTFFTSRDGRDGAKLLADAMASADDYDTLLARHEAKWAEKWESADVRIEGCDEDQRALRYNLFQLMQAAPRHDPRLSLGARGLSGEMHEGSVFWDNEIFKLPFFTLTDPDATRSMLTYRYKTLPAAKQHAKELWFDGAMYAWKAGPDGLEETEMGVGAYYAIHIVADIAYAIRQYWAMSGDDDFMFKYGAEILLETARFWKSRMQYDKDAKHYVIRAVRGPNEYDTIVHNNAYTNYFAEQNIRSALEAADFMRKERPEAWKKLAAKCKFTEAEGKSWKAVLGKMFIPRTQDGLILEDDAYLLRAPFDFKRGKVDGRRVVDWALPLEAMPFYQITKQSDVVTLINLFQDRFTLEDAKKAYDFYEPRTVHDSSLSFAPYAVMAARLGNVKDAYRYFRECAYLDIADTQLNSISGVHFANLGGTWQSVVFGFGGVMCGLDGDITINPHLPKEWKSLSFRLHLWGGVFEITIKDDKPEIKLVREDSAAGEVLAVQ